jgi:hypothetical protein
MVPLPIIHGMVLVEDRVTGRIQSWLIVLSHRMPVRFPVVSALLDHIHLVIGAF